jgi:hypothetical protein
LEQLDRCADEPEEEKQRRWAAAVSGRKTGRSHPLQDTLDIPDDDWNRISALADAVKGGVPRDDILTGLAMYREMLMWPKRRREEQERPPAERKRAIKIARLCESLVLEIGACSTELLTDIFKSPQDEGRWLVFDQSLEELRDRARIAGAPYKASRPHNVDRARDIVWTRLIEMYERATGKPARVSMGAACQQGYGEIVGFIQAFAAAVPGRPTPTADQIRAFERKCRGTRKRMVVSA